MFLRRGVRGRATLCVVRYPVLEEEQPRRISWKIVETMFLTTLSLGGTEPVDDVVEQIFS
jgi:hypothetical protein